MSQIIHPQLSYQVRGAMLDVYNALGPRLQERFYQAALALELKQRRIQAVREQGFEVLYEGQRVGLYYVDLWIEGGKMLVELKVAPKITTLHQAQALSYLKVTGADLAIVANYGEASFRDKRLIPFSEQTARTFHWQPKPVNPEWLYPDLIHHIQYACYRVHFILGSGFRHKVYRHAVQIELSRNHLGYEIMTQLPISYKGHALGTQAVRFILVEGKILLTAFALKTVDDAAVEQVKAALRHLNFRLGMMANFHGTAPTIKVIRV